MHNPLLWLADRWHRRHWLADPAAIAERSRGAPATVVTGGSEGIGLALAHEFARRGHTLVLVARRAGPLEAAAGRLREDYGVAAHAVPLDLTEPGADATLAAALAERGLWADVLVNNAGIGLGGPFAGQAPEAIDRLVALNIAALTRLTRRFLPDMLVRGRGGLLNVASLGGYAPGPNQAAYYASKAYVLALTRAIGYEVRGRGVSVCTLAPGPVETAFHARMQAGTALYRLLMPGASPARVARAGVIGLRLGRAVVLPGLLTAPLALCMRLLPTVLLLPIIAWLLAPRQGGGGNARG